MPPPILVTRALRWSHVCRSQTGAVLHSLPPPRTHRHRYYGVLAPNAPLRAAVTALAPVPVPPPPADPAGAQPASAQRAAARYLGAMLLARIYETLPLTCPFCLAEMRTIAFITEPSTVRQLLDHLGESSRPPRRATIRPGTTPPRRRRRSNSISASPGEEQRCRVLGTLGRPLQRTGNFWARPLPVRQLRAGARQHAVFLADWTAKTDIDHDQAVKDTRAWAIELPILILQTTRVCIVE